MPKGLDLHRKVDTNTAPITRPALSVTVLEVLGDVLRGSQVPGRLNSSVFSFDIFTELRDMTWRDSRGQQNSS